MVVTLRGHGEVPGSRAPDEHQRGPRDPRSVIYELPRKFKNVQMSGLSLRPA